MRLAHLHLPYMVPYVHSLRLQEALLEKHFEYNTHALQSSKSPTTRTTKSLSQPTPTLLTFHTDPVYTVGRRHLKSNPLSQSQVDFLTTNSSSSTSISKDATKLATFYSSPRGGLLTYHAPGQLTAYLILNLRYHSITPRCFIRLLENTIIRTCARHGVPNTMTTEDPGVWIGEADSESQGDTRTKAEICGGDARLRATTRKICAMGVHVTRGITSHGIGLNVFDAPIVPSPISDLYTLPQRSNEGPQPAPGYLSWGFSRIIACGLEGKSVTWLTKEGADANTSPDSVAKSLAEEVCVSLTRQGKVEISGIDSVSEGHVLAGTESP